MTAVHVVWDWNGTLFDDLDVVVESVSRSIVRYGLEPIDAEEYRNHFTRPVRRFYDSLFGRPVSDMEWEDLNNTYHDLYHASVHNARLAGDARASLERVSELGWTQSLLSMSTHSELTKLVDQHGIRPFFRSVSGLSSANGDLKVNYLRRHLDNQNLKPEQVIVVGDTPDDHAAAVEVGARSVAFDGGSHHRQVLDDIGVPVVHTLLSAVDCIEIWVSS